MELGVDSSSSGLLSSASVACSVFVGVIRPRSGARNFVADRGLDGRRKSDSVALGYSALLSETAAAASSSSMSAVAVGSNVGVVGSVHLAVEPAFSGSWGCHRLDGISSHIEFVTGAANECPPLTDGGAGQVDRLHERCHGLIPKPSDVNAAECRRR